MNIIPFDGNKNLPAYLKNFDVSQLNSDLTAHAGGGFPVLSTKQKQFAVVRDGNRTTLMNPKDPDAPATYVDVVILKANPNKSKVFYLKGYDPESSEGQKPDCYSSNGVEPAADATAKQSKKCATCTHNQWGSKITDKGAAKGKACSDTVRLAVAPAGQVNEPMLLRVPPASIKSLGEYGQMLGKRGVGYNMVVTKIAFDTESQHALTFKAVGFLDDAAFSEVQSTIQSDAVQNILGASVVADTAAANDEPVAVEKAPAVKAEPKPAPAPAPKPVAKAEKPADDDLEISLEGINFDDE